MPPLKRPIFVGATGSPQHPSYIPQGTIPQVILDQAVEMDASAGAKLLSSVTRREHTKRAMAAREALNISDSAWAVLSIDGGGARGLIPLTLLCRLEEQIGPCLHEVFDIITGTSTGAIIASLIAAGKSAQWIREFYKEKLPQIFQLARNGPPPEAYHESYTLDLSESEDQAFAIAKERQTWEAIEEFIQKAKQWSQQSGFGSPPPADGGTDSALRWAIHQETRNNGIELSKHLAHNLIKSIKADRHLRLISGSPVYQQAYLHDQLTAFFKEEKCETLGDLSRKNGCIVVLTAVDTQTGANVYMSATGQEHMFRGTCEDSSSASCVQASASAPLYFDAFKGDIADGGTLANNMPLLGALMHLERQSLLVLQFPSVPMYPGFGAGSTPIPTFGASPSTPSKLSKAGEVSAADIFNPNADQGPLVFQVFDRDATTIFSFGCGTGVVKPLTASPVDISAGQTVYGDANHPYGELGEAFSLANQIEAELPDLIKLAVATQIAGGLLGPVALLVGDLFLVSSAESDLAPIKDFATNVASAYANHRRFGLAAAVDAMTFLSDGLSRSAWTVQEQVFRSGLYKGDFRRFQISLDHDMIGDALFKYNKNYPYGIAEYLAGEPRYSIPWKVVLKGETLAEGKYDPFTFLYDLNVFTDTEGTSVGLEPLGGLGLRWLVCIAEEFADAVQDYFKSVKQPFLSRDLVDENGRDVFVSPAAADLVLPERWEKLKADLAPPRQRPTSPSDTSPWEPDTRHDPHHPIP